MQDNELLTVFTFDEDGYFAGLSAWQFTEADGLLKTNDATTVCPWGADAPDHASWYRWDAAKWVKEPKPTRPEDLVGVAVSMGKNTPHAVEVRNLIREFAKLEGFREKQTDQGLELEKIPEKSKAQKEEEAIEQEMKAYDEKVDNLRKLVGIALLENNEEELARLRAEYAQLEGE